MNTQLVFKSERLKMLDIYVNMTGSIPWTIKQFYINSTKPAHSFIYIIISFRPHKSSVKLGTLHKIIWTAHEKWFKHQKISARVCMTPVIYCLSKTCLLAFILYLLASVYLASVRKCLSDICQQVFFWHLSARVYLTSVNKCLSDISQ